MSRFFKKQGFTLIELMVVIVIIGVLASLAIPRFTEASAKAKVAEAPRVIASFESAYLAAVAETGTVSSLDDLIFNVTAVNSDSKWWAYGATTAGVFSGSAKSKMGIFETSHGLQTTYNSSVGSFAHSAIGIAAASAKKYVPNFFRSGE